MTAAAGARGATRTCGGGCARRRPGFSFADPYAIALVFAGVALFAAIGALSHQRERAFSASLIYLGLGLGAAVIIEVLGVPWISPLRDAALIEHIAEFAVIVALFGTGLRLERALHLAVGDRWLGCSGSSCR